MRDPDLQPAIELGFYSAEKGKREFPRDSILGLTKSLNKAHDNITRSARIITELQMEMRGMRREYRVKLWCLAGAVAAEAAFIGWLIDWFK